MKRITKRKGCNASEVLLDGMKEVIENYQRALRSERIKCGIARKKALIAEKAYD